MEFDVEIDTSAAPLYLLSITGAPQSPEQLHGQLLDRLERLYARREPMAEVYDLRGATPPPREVRQYLTAWLAVYCEQIHESALAVAVVMRSRAMRLLFSAIWMIQPPPAQTYRTFADRRAALEWSQRALAAAGVAVPDAAFSELLGDNREQYAG